VLLLLGSISKSVIICLRIICWCQYDARLSR